MTRKLFFFVFIVSSACIFAQKKSAFITNIKGSENSTDSLPHFLYTKAELDSFLLCNSIIPIEDESIGMSVHVYTSFFVDTLSNLLDINVSNVDIKTTAMFVQKYSMDSVKVYYAKESKRLISLTKDLWVVNKTNSKNRLNIIIPFISESYEQKRKDALKPSSYDYGKLIKYDLYNKNVRGAKKGYRIINYYDLGVKKMNQNKLLLAKKYFEQAIQIKADDIDAYYNMGICYLKLNDNPHACKCWEMGQKLGDTGVLDLINKYCK